MDTEKIVGYLLLVVGLLIIFGSAFSVFQIFTGQKKAPSIVSFELPEVALPGQGTAGILNNLDLPEGVDVSAYQQALENVEVAGDQASFKLLPDELVNQMVNMMIYLILMGFIASAGAKVASIGVKLIKDIKVVVKEDKIRSVKSSASETVQS